MGAGTVGIDKPRRAGRTARSTPVTPAAQRSALVALYGATDGPNWIRNANWNTAAPVRDWYGVATDTSGNITHLYLHRNRLAGGIPAEIGDLANLTRLDLVGNQLTGCVTASLSTGPRVTLDAGVSFCEPARVSVTDASVSDSDSEAVFTVWVQPGTDTASAPVSVRWATVSGTAAPGSDYTGSSGTLRIPAGARQATITVPVTDDSTPETTETFTIGLSQPSVQAESVSFGRLTARWLVLHVPTIVLLLAGWLEYPTGDRRLMLYGAAYFGVVVLPVLVSRSRRGVHDWVAGTVAVGAGDWDLFGADSVVLRHASEDGGGADAAGESAQVEGEESPAEDTVAVLVAGRATAVEGCGERFVSPDEVLSFAASGFASSDSVSFTARWASLGGGASQELSVPSATTDAEGVLSFSWTVPAAPDAATEAAPRAYAIQASGENPEGGAHTAMMIDPLVAYPSTVPCASADTASTSPGTAVQIAVLANDVAPAGGSLDAPSVEVRPAFGGTLGANSTTGAVTFAPDPGYWGTVETSYAVYDGWGVGVEADLTVTVDAGCTIVGTPAVVEITGTEGDDVICVPDRDDWGAFYVIDGRGGDDVILAGAGVEWIYGGTGEDTVTGGGGDDLIWGGPGADTLDGHAGNDILEGRGHDDELHGGPGEDTLRGGAGDDRLWGGIDADTLDGGNGTDHTDGGPDCDDS